MKHLSRILTAWIALLPASVVFAADVATIAPEALLARSARDDASLVILDVRTPEEFARGHVRGAKNIPYDQLPDRIAELKGDKQKDIVVYCHSGRRARIAAETLKSKGFEKLLHLEGDMIKWTEAKRPLERIRH